MTDDQRSELVDRINKMSKIEVAYLRRLFMDYFPFVALGHTHWDIIWAIDCCIENEYDKILKLMNNIDDHSKWKYNENIFLNEEQEGLYDD